MFYCAHTIGVQMEQNGGQQDWKLQFILLKTNFSHNFSIMNIKKKHSRLYDTHAKYVTASSKPKCIEWYKK